MGVKGRVQDFFVHQTIEQILSLVPRMSNDALVEMTRLAERVAPQDPKIIGPLRKMRRYFETGHPCVELGKNVLKRLHPNCRKKVIQNFFIHAFLTGIRRSMEFRAREGIDAPWFLVLSPTMRCNLNCTGCSTRRFARDTDLPFEVMDRLLKECKEEMGIHFIVTQGGEMFVRRDMFDLYRKHSDIFFQVYTNGTLLDRETCRTLRDLGNVAPMVSLEGFEEDTDRRRGKGVFRKAMQAMDTMREEGVLFGFSVTQTRENTDVVTSEKFIDFLIEKGCLVGWYFQFLPIGKGPELSLMPTPEQRNRLRLMVNRVRETRPIFIGDFWNDGPYVGGCIAGGRCYLHINNRGDVEPCAFVHFAVDNIKEKPLKEALKSSFFRFIREKQPFNGGNLLTPCMIIDAPEILREAVARCGAKPTHEGAEEVLTGEVARGLDEYSRRMRALYGPVWEDEFGVRAVCIEPGAEAAHETNNVRMTDNDV